MARLVPSTYPASARLWRSATSPRGVPTRRLAAEIADRRRLLRARRERPRRRAAEQRDELAPLHSITPSARASSVVGISKHPDGLHIQPSAWTANNHRGTRAAD